MQGSMLGLRQVGRAWCTNRMSRREEEEGLSEQLPASSLEADEDHERVVESSSPEWVVKGKSLFEKFLLSIILFKIV